VTPKRVYHQSLTGQIRECDYLAALIENGAICQGIAYIRTACCTSHNAPFLSWIIVPAPAGIGSSLPAYG
jgi:hypothetical protein